MFQFTNPVVGGVALLVPAIQSVPFVSGSTGWQIAQNGSSEFNNGVFRGTLQAAVFEGTDFVINSVGEFRYSGAPAANNLIYTDVSAATVDPYNNQVPAGVTFYGYYSGTAYAETISLGGVFSAYTNASGTTQQGAWVLNNYFYQGVADFLSSGPVSAIQPGSGFLGPPETWHNMTMLNTWTFGTGYAEYKLEPNNRVSVRGANITPGTITNGTSVWTPPTGYVPTQNRQTIPLVVEVGTEPFSADYARWDMTPTGMQIQNLPSTVTRVGFNASYALD